MGLYDKISDKVEQKLSAINELEKAEEAQSHANIPASSRKWTTETLSIELPAERKIPAIIGVTGFGLMMAFLFLGDETALLFEICALVVLICMLIPFRAFMVTKVSFHPEKIVYETCFGGQYIVPTHSLEILVNEQSFELFNGTRKNINESVGIVRKFVSDEEFADSIKYAEDVYGVKPRVDEGTTVTGTSTNTSSIAYIEFEKAVSSYKVSAGFIVLFSLVVIFTAGVAGRFTGFAPAFPAYPVRFGCICLAIGAYFLLRRLNISGFKEINPLDPVTNRLKSLGNSSILQGFVAVGVVALGFALFLLFGNRLDYYFFLLVGTLFHLDYFPRYSVWEQIVNKDTGGQAKAVSPEQMGFPKRSLQVSLVLMGTLSVISYGQSSYYMYKNRQDCRDDWGADDKNCQEMSGNHDRYRVRGPRYGTPGKPTRSAGVGTISRGGFGSLGKFHASFGG